MTDRDAIKVDRMLDCLGLYCPEPIFRTRVELDSMNDGEVLEVVADDPSAYEDIPRLAKRTGHEVLQLLKEDNRIRIWIRKKRI